MKIHNKSPNGAPASLPSNPGADRLLPVVAHIVSHLPVCQAASCRQVNRDWQNVIDAHGTLAYGARANGHRVSRQAWHRATSGDQQTWKQVAHALQQREPPPIDSFNWVMPPPRPYLINDSSELRAWLQQHVLPRQPQFDLTAGLDMAAKLQKYWACRILDSAAHRMPEDFATLWSRILLGFSGEPLPVGLTDGPALQGAQALLGTSRVDSYGRGARQRRAVGALMMDGYLALGTEYAAPVMVGRGRAGTDLKPNLTVAVVAENEARTARRFFRFDVGCDRNGRLQIDQPDPFGPKEGFVQSQSTEQTKLPKLLFLSTSYVETLFENSWSAPKIAAHRRRAASYLAQLLAGARLEHLDAVMPEDEQEVRPWFGDSAPARDRRVLPCGYRLARADELPLFKLAAAAAPQAD